MATAKASDGDVGTLSRWATGFDHLWLVMECEALWGTRLPHVIISSAGQVHHRHWQVIQVHFSLQILWSHIDSCWIAVPMNWTEHGWNMYTFCCNIIVMLFWIFSMVFPNCLTSNCRISHIKGWSLKSENSHPWWPNSLLKLCQLSRQSLCKAVLGVTCFVVLKSGKTSDGWIHGSRWNVKWCISWRNCVFWTLRFEVILNQKDFRKILEFFSSSLFTASTMCYQVSVKYACRSNS